MWGTYLEEQDWETVEMMLKFLQVFYLVITAFINIYIPSSHTALHNIYEIIKYFTKYNDHYQLQHTIIPIKIKILKYYKKLLLLYYLDSRFKLTRLYNILRLISHTMRYDYVGMHYKLVEERFKAVFKAYQKEHWNEETQSLKCNIPFHVFESPVKHTYLDYEDDAR